MILPECAPLGTVTIRLAPLVRRCAPGELRLMRAPGRRGKATTIPACRPLPVSASVPCTDTWCGFEPQRDAGVQLALVMRTEVTCAEGELAIARAGRVVDLAAGAACAGGTPRAGAVPPAPAASAPSGASSGAHSEATAVAAARSVSRLCATVLAKRFPSRQLLSPPDGGVRG